MLRARFASLWFATALVLFLSTAAHAGDTVAAEALFREGKRLMDAGQHEEACPKFAASMAAEPSVGAMLNLALCHEQTGRIALAWAEYKKAAAMAAQAGQDKRRKGALEHADRLAPRLPRITLEVREKAPGLIVERDGERVAAATFGSALPVDPGPHHYHARSPGKRSWSTDIVIDEAEEKTIVIPALQQESEGSMGPVRLAGLVVLGVGAAVLGVGIGLGVKALSDTDALDETCPNRECPGAAAQADDIRPLAHGSTAAIVVGAAAIAAGIIMAVIGDDDTEDAETGFRMQPYLGPNSGGAVLTVAF